jgi:hypothetical protein
VSNIVCLFLSSFSQFLLLQRIHQPIKLPTPYPDEVRFFFFFFFFFCAKKLKKKKKNPNYMDNQQFLPRTSFSQTLYISEYKFKFIAKQNASVSIYISTDERVTKNVAKLMHPYTPYFFLWFLELEIYTANIIWVISLFFPPFFCLYFLWSCYFVIIFFFMLL